jgi:glucokinase
VRGAAEPAVVGIDVGGTKVAAGRVAGARATDIAERPTDLSSPAALLDEIESAARESIEGGGAVDAVGVGVPSQVDFASGTVVASVNIPLEGVGLRAELESRLGTRVYVDNDANCAALAEAQFTDDAPAESLVMLTLGTGVGGGVVIDGRLYHGWAELGHTVIVVDGEPCFGACTGRGHLEAYASGTAATLRAQEAFGPAADAHRLVRLAREGDERARAILDDIGRHLGAGIGSLINIFDPDLVVIGGGFAAAGDLILESAREVAGREALTPADESAEIVRAELGTTAGVIGAGLVAFEAPA